MGSISGHITPLVINSLGADTHTHGHAHTNANAHTHTHTHKHTHTHMHTDDPYRITFKKPGVRWPVAGARLV